MNKEVLQKILEPTQRLAMREVGQRYRYQECRGSLVLRFRCRAEKDINTMSRIATPMWEAIK